MKNKKITRSLSSLGRKEKSFLVKADVVTILTQANYLCPSFNEITSAILTKLLFLISLKQAQ
jgi:hypothetical protein